MLFRLWWLKPSQILTFFDNMSEKQDRKQTGQFENFSKFIMLSSQSQALEFLLRKLAHTSHSFHSKTFCSHSTYRKRSVSGNTHKATQYIGSVILNVTHRFHMIILVMRYKDIKAFSNPLCLLQNRDTVTQKPLTCSESRDEGPTISRPCIHFYLTH